MILFLYPFVGLLLFVLVGLVWFSSRKGKSHIEDIFTKEVLQRLRLEKSVLSQTLQKKLFVVAMALAIVALMRPIMIEQEGMIQSDVHDVVIAVDISKSMQQKDLFPSRLILAKKKLVGFLEQATKMRIGLLIYDDEAYRVFPKSTDIEGVLYLLKQGDFPEGVTDKSNLFAAIEAANSMLKSSKNKHLVIISDGGGKVSRKAEQTYLKDNAIMMHYILLNREENPPLKTLVEQTGGIYEISSWDDKDIINIHESIQNSPTNKQLKKYDVPQQVELFIYPLFLAVCLLFFYYHGSAVFGIFYLLGFLLMPHSSLKADILDFIKLDKIQTLEKEQAYQSLIVLYQSLPDTPHKYYNLGNTFYKKGAYEEAITMYKKAAYHDKKLQAKTLHNIANAYIHLNKWMQAKTHLEKALQTYALRESRKNLAYIKKRIDQQKQRKGKKRKEEKILFKGIDAKQNVYKEQSSRYRVKLTPISYSQEERWLQRLAKDKTVLFVQKLPTTKRSLDAKNP